MGRLRFSIIVVSVVGLTLDSSRRGVQSEGRRRRLNPLVECAAGRRWHEVGRIEGRKRINSLAFFFAQDQKGAQSDHLL
jgi:hypothetical protein